MIILILLLIISVSLNALLVWYCKKLLNKITFFGNGVEDFQDKLKLLSEHLQTVHELEMFYGEPVLQNLIKHMKATVIDINVFRESFIISEGQQEGMINEEKSE
jgi:hypothetical protein